jgi:multidrug efflux pump subunit AcrA (membrane-fusion protein)
MSTLITSTPVPSRKRPPKKNGFRRWRNAATVAVLCAAVVAAGTFYGIRFSRALNGGKKPAIPTARVERGDITLSVFARGEIRGGNPEMLTAPLTGGSDMHITFLRKSGEEVKAGDVVVQFDTTEQEYKRKEAEADLAEADQHVLQATAQMKADEEEDRYALLKAKTDVMLAELDVRKDPLLPSITARQNDLALQSARDHLSQLQQNLTNRKATDEAGITMQQAGRGKAESQALTARQNIDAMTLRAQRSGYVSLKQNSSGNFFFFGMTLPLYQVGDQVRPGMAVAEIPDLKNWELSANIGELDRGHLAVGEKVAITVIAVPDRKFTGRVKELGGTTGPPWDRHFECKMTLDNPSPELRPGMSAKINVTTDELHQVLWLPAQALFESDGRTFVYVRSGASFTAKDVKLVRRNETRVVITGVNEGQEVALASPVESSAKKTSASGPLESLPR